MSAANPLASAIHKTYDQMSDEERRAWDRACEQVRRMPSGRGICRPASARTLRVVVDGRQANPQGFPSKLLPALDEVRAMLDGLRLGSWHWYKVGDRHNPAGTFVVTFDDGSPGYRGHHDGLAAWLDEVRPGWRAAPAPKQARAKVAKVAEPAPAEPEPVPAQEPEPAPVTDAPTVELDEVAHTSRAAGVLSATPELAAYLSRLVYGPKVDYARAFAEHLLTGAPAPADPGADWSAKVRAKVARYARSAA